MRISLGIITRGEVCIETVLSLFHLFKESPHEFHFNFRKGTYVNQLRNECMQEALKIDADYLFFVDSDMAFEADALKKLLSHNVDIVGAMYNMKVIPPVNTIKLLAPDGTMSKLTKYEIPNELFELFAIPTGLMLIRLAAVKHILNPFDFGRDKLTGELIGDDVNFCIKCKKIGLKIWCDPTIKVGHIGSYMY